MRYDLSPLYRSTVGFDRLFIDFELSSLDFLPLLELEDDDLRLDDGSESPSAR